MKMSLVLLFVAVCFLFGPVSSVDPEETKGAETHFETPWVNIWCPAGTVNVGESAPVESGNVLCLTNQKTKQACTTLQTTGSEQVTYSCIELSQCTGDEYSEYYNCMTAKTSAMKCCCKDEKCKNAIFTAPEPTTTTSTDSAETIGTVESKTTKMEKPAITTKKPTTTTETLTTTTDTESATESTASATEEETVEGFSATAKNSSIDANVTVATPPSHEAQTGNWPLYLSVSLGVLALLGAVGAGAFIFFQRKKRESLKKRVEKCSIGASVGSTFEPLGALDTGVQ